MNQADNRLSEDELADQWHSFQLKVWRRLHEVIDESREAGIDQKEIACRLGMNEAQLSRILSGRNNVTLRTMHNIARALGYRPEVEFVNLMTLRPSNSPTFAQAPSVVAGGGKPVWAHFEWADRVHA